MEKSYNSIFSELYEPEELVPIVAELAKRYTSFESTSVTYEQAERLMEAVLYCIRFASGKEEEYEKESSNPFLYSDIEKKLPAKAAYELGYHRVLEAVKDVQKKYNEMIVDFCDYGNKNYRDTVRKAIPGFFLYYDVRFAPQENMITFDYPTLWSPDALYPDFMRPAHCWQGIEAIERYITCICLEQKFLGRLPQGYVVQILDAYDGSYRDQFYNICEVVLWHVLGSMMKMLRDRSMTVKELLWQLVEQEYGGDKKLYAYLKNGLSGVTMDSMNVY